MFTPDQTADAVWNWLSFLWDNWKELAKSAGDVVLTTAANVWESAYSTIDWLWDAAAWSADTISALWNKISPNIVKTDYSKREWYLDKKGKEVAQWAKDLESFSDSKWTKDSRAMEMFWDGVQHAADIFQIVASGGAWLGVKAWGWLLKIWMKGVGAPVTIPLNFIKGLKQTPQAATELKALFEAAKASWKVVSQPEVNAIVAKYGSASIPKLIKWTEIGSKRMASHLLKNVGPEDIAKLPPSIKSKILDWAWKLVSAELIDAGLDDDEVAQVEAVVWSKETVDPGITMPTADPKVDKKEFSPTWAKPEEEPTSIADKKKELQVMKEKNVWTLNASTSVVDLMKMLWANSTMEARKMLFEKLTSKPYEGTAEQNMQLKDLVEEMFAKGTLNDAIQPIKR